MNKKTIIIATLFGFFMSGCFSVDAPKCSDEDVEDTVKEIYLDVLKNAQDPNNSFLAAFTDGLPTAITKLSTQRAIAYDENVKLRSCKADALFDNNQTIEINYTVQLDEQDSDQFYVELDTEFLSTLMQQSMLQGIWKK